MLFPNIYCFLERMAFTVNLLLSQFSAWKCFCFRFHIRSNNSSQNCSIAWPCPDLIMIPTNTGDSHHHVQHLSSMYWKDIQQWTWHHPTLGACLHLVYLVILRKQNLRRTIQTIKLFCISIYIASRIIPLECRMVVVRAIPYRCSAFGLFCYIPYSIRIWDCRDAIQVWTLYSFLHLIYITVYTIPQEYGISPLPRRSWIFRAHVFDLYSSAPFHEVPYGVQTDHNPTIHGMAMFILDEY